MINDIWLRAAQNGNLKRIKMMKQGLDFLDINCISKLGQSALMLAVRTGDVKIIKYLLKIGVDSDLVDKEGENALSLALRFGKEKICEMLYNKGCRVRLEADAEILQKQKELEKRIENWRNSRYLICSYLKNKIKLV